MNDPAEEGPWSCGFEHGKYRGRGKVLLKLGSNGTEREEDGGISGEGDAGKRSTEMGEISD